MQEGSSVNVTDGFINMKALRASWLREKEDLEAQNVESKEKIRIEQENITNRDARIKELDQDVTFATKVLKDKLPETTGSPSQTMPMTTLQRAEEVVMTLEKAILNLVDSQPNKEFQSGEIIDALAGYPSASGNFRSLMFSKLNELVRKGKIGFKKNGRNYQYHTLTNKSSGSFIQN